MPLNTVPQEEAEEPSPRKSLGRDGVTKKTFWGRQTGRGSTHRDEGLADTGEQVWTQRMD